MAFFSQLLLLEVPRVSAFISPTDKRTETRQPPIERVRFFLSCHVNNSISRFAAIRLVFQYWVTICYKQKGKTIARMINDYKLIYIMYYNAITIDNYNIPLIRVVIFLWLLSVP